MSRRPSFSRQPSLSKIQIPQRVDTEDGRRSGSISPAQSVHSAGSQYHSPNDYQGNYHEYDQSSQHNESRTPQLGGQAQYMVQEQAYLHRLRSNMVDDEQDLHPVGEIREIIDVDADSDDEELDSLITDPAALPENLFALSLDPERDGDAEKIKERTEWQTMLTSVLTGEIFTSEKTRLAGAATNASNDEQAWLELKAKVTCRSDSEQKRTVMVGRSMTHEVLEHILNFQLSGSFDTMEEPYEAVGDLLDSLERCEALWPNLRSMKEFFPVYASQEFQDRVDALTSWFTTTQSILQERELLQAWTGNYECDPTKLPDIDAEHKNSFDSHEHRKIWAGYRRTSVVEFGAQSDEDHMEGINPDTHLSLVQLVMKQEGALESIFRTRIKGRLFPLIERARTCTINYSTHFLEMGLPLFLLGLGSVMSFPVRLTRAAIVLRLDEAASLTNPTMTMIDEAISKFRTYMSLGINLTEEYIRVTDPVLDKGWIFTSGEDTSINDVMLRCIRFYLDLLSNKFLDGGRTSMSFFRNFKSIEELESHFTFLQGTCRLIDGGDISVAIQFSTLYSRVLTRLIAYWEHQIEGPSRWKKNEVDRWYTSSLENIRSIQRKLLRFYKILANTYENAIEFALPVNRTKDFLTWLRDYGFFLIFVGSMERMGCYTFASRSLRDNPITIRNLVQGYSRPNLEEEGENGAIVLLTLTEAIRWDGEIFKLDIGNDTLPEFNGKVRLVAQGGFREVQEMRRLFPPLNKMKVTVDRRSHLDMLENDLHKMRTTTYRLTMTVLSSALGFRARLRGLECQETVQAMLSFAHEFGQRGRPLLSEARRSRITRKLFDLCLEWIEFVSDDCPPSDNKTFKWTVQALEFAMIMTKGVNILAVPEEQFAKLRRKVAACVTLLISHFDIMGARSKAANLTNHHNRARLIQNSKDYGAGPTSLKDDDVVIAVNRMVTKKKLAEIDSRLTPPYAKGKILDRHNTEFEFLSFASSPFTTAAMRWTQLERIGSGAFGSVFKARSVDDFQIMAVKEVPIRANKDISNVLRNIKDEMTVLEMVSHPNIVQYYGVEVHRDRVYIFMEYCSGGSLASFLASTEPLQDEKIVSFYTLQMFEGLAYLHQSGIVHRDIKPQNILLTKRLNYIKIVDFGAAKIVADTSNVSHQTKIEARGTFKYMAPEVLRGEPSAVESSVDIWSMGCVMLEMVAGHAPWEGYDNDYTLMYNISNRKVPKIPADSPLSPACLSILERCLKFDPKERPSAMDLLRDPWFDIAREALQGMRDPYEDDTFAGDQDYEFYDDNDDNHSDHSQSPVLAQYGLDGVDGVDGGDYTEYTPHTATLEEVSNPPYMKTIAESNQEYELEHHE